mmetsp:Transcript_17545/g.44175  ORF Transcript_17545/g.44175 Transcript_17545/m.44175 type:complete len:209 (-) Transcript_17545:116-742(-)
MENFNRVLLGAAFDQVERTIDDTFGNGLLTVAHDLVHELRDNDVLELRIRKGLALLSRVTTRHASASLLRLLRTIVRTALLTVFDGLGIQGTTHDVIAHARKVFHTAAADQHNRVLLQVVAFARNIAQRFEAGRQAHLGHFTKRGVRLLWRGCVDARTNAATLWASLEGRCLGTRRLWLTRFANKLLNRWHSGLLSLLISVARWAGNE